MNSSIRRHLSYANVTATLALVFAMSGGALAAKHYLITSTNQIGPKILKSLKGHVGATGKAGATGAQGTTGPQGTSGAPGRPGQDGTARAYGVVQSTGNVAATKTKGLTASRIETGVYCVTPTASGIDPSTVQPIAESDETDNPAFRGIVQTVDAGSNDFPECPGGWVFVTEDEVSGTWKKANIAFSVIVP